jgi:hypothetical protein
MFKGKVDYDSLNARQKEIYNFQKVSAIFAEYGYTTIKLSDDWMGADFIAISFDGLSDLKVQLKGTLVFDQRYCGKNLLICFFERKGGEIKNLYVYPHDDLLSRFLSIIGHTESWRKNGYWFSSTISVNFRKELEEYRIA